MNLPDHVAELRAHLAAETTTLDGATSMPCERWPGLTDIGARDLLTRTDDPWTLPGNGAA